MKIENIKPIPKYILKLIIQKDKSFYHNIDGNVRYYAYLTKNDKELVKITVAVKHKYKKFYCKICAVHGIHSSLCFAKDMCFSYISGYIVGWYSEGLTKYKKWYEDDEFGTADDKYFDMYAPIVNIDYIDKFPEYKYSAAKLYTGTKLFQYLRLYEQYPQIEYLMKAGLESIAQSVTILKRVGKDKKFCKWLMHNRHVIADGHFYKDVILRAYLSNKDIKLLQREKSIKLKFAHDTSFSYLKERFTEDKVKILIRYFINNNVSAAAYSDYLRACDYLHIDMEKEKNLVPHDFKRWHDIRTDEYHTAFALENEKHKKELYDKFRKVAEKYLPLQYDKKREFTVFIPKSPIDLINEGKELNHCVGSMNYDQKFVREESLIFFIRNSASPDVPFVTLEYSLSKHKVLQCYGVKDSTPDEKVLNYVNKIWLPFANKQIKKMAV